MNDVVAELTRLGAEYIFLRENVDTTGPLGPAIVVIFGVVAELEGNLIIERVLQITKGHRVSTTKVQLILKEAAGAGSARAVRQSILNPVPPTLGLKGA